MSFELRIIRIRIRIRMIANAKEILDASTIENSRIEYKADWNPEKIMHTICAFANDMENIGGGYIIIGVEEENGIPVRPINVLSTPSFCDRWLPL